jgi:hypothetical protein
MGSKWDHTGRSIAGNNRALENSLRLAGWGWAQTLDRPLAQNLIFPP